MTQYTVEPTDDGRLTLITAETRETLGSVAYNPLANPTGRWVAFDHEGVERSSHADCDQAAAAVAGPDAVQVRFVF